MATYVPITPEPSAPHPILTSNASALGEYFPVERATFAPAVCVHIGQVRHMETVESASLIKRPRASSDRCSLLPLLLVACLTCSALLAVRRRSCSRRSRLQRCRELSRVSLSHWRRHLSKSPIRLLYRRATSAAAEALESCAACVRSSVSHARASSVKSTSAPAASRRCTLAAPCASTLKPNSNLRASVHSRAHIYQAADRTSPASLNFRIWLHHGSAIWNEMTSSSWTLVANAAVN